MVAGATVRSPATLPAARPGVAAGFVVAAPTESAAARGYRPAALATVRRAVAVFFWPSAAV